MPKLYLVTGAASGIGLRLTRDLLARGALVVAADLNLQALEAQAERFALQPYVKGSDRGVWLRQLDVRDAAAWAALLDSVVTEIGVPDAVFNVAGFLRAGLSHEDTLDVIDTTIDVNLKGVMHGTNAAARVMLPAGRGHIVNIASLAGIAAAPGIAAYSASKHGVRGFSLAVAQELAPHGINVSVVCPGLVDTPMLDAQLNHAEASLAFSGTRALRVDEISLAIIGALHDKPLELVLDSPFSAQGSLAKLLGAFPALVRTLGPIAAKIGQHQQQKLKRSGR